MTHTSLPGNEPRRCRGRDDCDPGSPPKHLEPLRLSESTHMNSFDQVHLQDRQHRVRLVLVYAERGSAGEPQELAKVMDYNVARALAAALGRYLHIPVDYNIPMELPEAQRIHKTYQNSYPGVPVYWEKQIAKDEYGEEALFRHDTLRVDADSTSIGIAVQLTAHPYARSTVFMASDQTRQIFDWLSLWLEREVTSHQHTGG